MCQNALACGYCARQCGVETNDGQTRNAVIPVQLRSFKLLLTAQLAVPEYYDRGPPLSFKRMPWSIRHKYVQASLYPPMAKSGSSNLLDIHNTITTVRFRQHPCQKQAKAVLCRPWFPVRCSSSAGTGGQGLWVLKGSEAVTPIPSPVQDSHSGDPLRIRGGSDHRSKFKRQSLLVVATTTSYMYQCTQVLLSIAALLTAP